MENIDLIKVAASVVEARKEKDNLIGDVGCALQTVGGNIYTGVCASISSNTFCAEKSAVGAMLTVKESKIKTIVAVWKDEKGEIYVIPPCGSCRQMLKEVDKDNLETDVIIKVDKTVKLKELLPYHDSWEKVE